LYCAVKVSGKGVKLEKQGLWQGALSEKNQKMSFLEALPDIAFELVAKLCFAFIIYNYKRNTSCDKLKALDYQGFQKCEKPCKIKASRNVKKQELTRLSRRAGGEGEDSGR